MGIQHQGFIGAGFGGMYMLKKLRDEQGLKVRVFDKAGGAGVS